MDPQADLKAAKELAETVEVLKDSFKSLGVIIKQQVNDNIIDADAFTKAYAKSLKSDITQAFNNLGRKSEELLKNQESLTKGQAKEKDILKQITQNELKRKNLAIDLVNAAKNGIISASEAKKLHLELKAVFEEQNKELAKQAEHAAKTEAAMGNLGNIVKGLNRIPILGGLINSEKVMEKMQESAAKTGSKTAVMATGFKEVGKSVKAGLLDPLTIATLLINSILKANRQTVELGKALGKNSYEYRENLAQSVRFANNVNYTTANLVESFNELTNATGLAYEFTVDQLEVQTKLTKQVGLQADEAAQIQRFGVLNSKTSEQTYNSFVKGLVATRNQLKIGINFKATLAEAVKVSGQLAANLGYNPERIAKAVVAAKAFGMTLDQVAKSGESLLNFESSIENELKAELITGKQLNLEKARYAALTGDQITLAEELNKQVGTAAEFTQMNVIQQKSLAEAVGMTTDELANTLRKREEAIKSGKSLAQITEEEAKIALERQTIQDKFNASILKLQDFFGNLVAGPLGRFVSFLAEGLDYVSAIAVVFGTIYAYQKGMALYQGAMALMKGKELAVQIGIAAAWAVANPFTALAGLAIAGGIASLVAGQMSAAPKFATGGIVTSEINNATIGEAGPEAIIPLNSPKANSILGGGGNIDLTPMIAAINEVKAAITQLGSRPSVAYINGKDAFSRDVSTTSVQNTYKLA
jgi:hypothetical protein